MAHPSASPKTRRQPRTKLPFLISAAFAAMWGLSFSNLVAYPGMITVGAIFMTATVNAFVYVLFQLPTRPDGGE